MDAKTQYPAVCNATETLLVHREAAATLLPHIGAALLAKGVTLHADPEARAILLGDHQQEKERIVAASQDAWATEWLTLDLSVKVVSSVHEAVQHINRYGSGHTDAVITEDTATAVSHDHATRFCKS